jgi:hypothetical protein
MPSMIRCRFQNTLADLRDCYECMDDGDFSEAEKKSRTRVLKSADTESQESEPRRDWLWYNRHQGAVKNW